MFFFSVGYHIDKLNKKKAFNLIIFKILLNDEVSKTKIGLKKLLAHVFYIARFLLNFKVVFKI